MGLVAYCLNQIVTHDNSGVSSRLAEGGDSQIKNQQKNHRNAVEGSAYTCTAHTLCLDQLHY
jgi:hypothetical protein